MERLQHVRADLVAARTDRRTNGGEALFGARPEAFDHQAKSAFREASECPPPSGVNGGASACPRVEEEDRRTIGRVDAQHNPTLARHDGVANGRSLSPPIPDGGIEDHTTIRMPLPQGEQRPMGEPHGGEESNEGR